MTAHKTFITKFPLPTVEWLDRFKQRLIDGYQLSEERAQEWTIQTAEDRLLYASFKNDPEAAADDDFNFAE